LGAVGNTSEASDDCDDACLSRDTNGGENSLSLSARAATDPGADGENDDNKVKEERSKSDRRSRQSRWRRGRRGRVTLLRRPPEDSQQVVVQGDADPQRQRHNSVMRRQENRLTRISLSIVSLFVACHVWRLIPTAFEALAGGKDWPAWLVHVNHVSHTLIVFNSAVNFLLYIVW